MYGNIRSPPALQWYKQTQNKKKGRLIMKIYDVYFKSISSSVISVEANSIKEAFDEAQKILNNMSREELIERLLAAYDYEGFEIVQVKNTGEEV